MSLTTTRRLRWPLALGAVAALLAVLLSTASLASAAVTMHGTYTTSTRQGTVSFTPLRAFRGGVEGRFKIDGKAYPGSEYAATGGSTGLVWYYGTSGIMAGNALVAAQPDGTSSGPIWFFSRQGTQTDTGTLTAMFP